MVVVMVVILMVEIGGVASTVTIAVVEVRIMIGHDGTASLFQVAVVVVVGGAAGGGAAHSVGSG